MNLYDVHFGDEVLAPGKSVHPFGSGHRRIIVVSRGNKWSQLLCADTCESAEMLNEIFERLKPVELLMGSYQEMAVRLKRLAADYNRESSIYREAMKELGFPVAKSELQIAEDKARATRMTEAREKKVIVAGTGETPGQNEGSGLFIKRLWMTGKYTPERLVELVLMNYPGRTTKVSDVYYNYKKLLEANTPDVPPWPAKEKKSVNPLKVTVVKGKPDEPPKPEKKKAARTKGKNPK